MYEKPTVLLQGHLPLDTVCTAANNYLVVGDVFLTDALHVQLGTCVRACEASAGRIYGTLRVQPNPSPLPELRVWGVPVHRPTWLVGLRFGAQVRSSSVLETLVAPMADALQV